MAARPTEEGSKDANVQRARSVFQQRADFDVAYQLQQREFDHHYTRNRTERQQVGGDVKITKTEQTLEDQYAAEYREQLRRDREQEDARLAAQLQEQVMRAEEEEKRKLRSVDEELARRLQSQEQANANSNQSQHQNGLMSEDERLARQLQRELQMGSNSSSSGVISSCGETSAHRRTDERSLIDFSDVAACSSPKPKPPRPPPPNCSKQHQQQQQSSTNNNNNKYNNSVVSLATTNPFRDYDWSDQQQQQQQQQHNNFNFDINANNSSATAMDNARPKVPKGGVRVLPPSSGSD